MKLFNDYDKIVNEVKGLFPSEIREEFNKLDDNKQIDILIRWFGIIPLLNNMLETEKGQEQIKKDLINLKYYGELRF